MRLTRRFATVLGAILSLVNAAPAAAQSEPGWNSPRALELIRSARDRRSAAADSGLYNYQATAQGRVYFYLDREDTGQRNLVRTDQLALEVFWQSPDLVKQRIVGWRDERTLPTNIRYHLDHLSVVQENFGDEIRIGDGDEVQNVTHPAAPEAERAYDYRLIDSLTLALPGAPEPVRVYQVSVRPKDPSRPGFVGSVFIERSRGDIVRMDFTFTSASYVDRYLDQINISLDNGLWRGRYWLPNEQRVEIRRRIPQLDIPAGAIIRANMRIGDYVFDQPLPFTLFTGPPVIALPREVREAYAFDEPLDAELREMGLGPGMELSEIRAEALRLLRESALRRTAPLRFSAGRASDVLRFNRTEGLAIGLGAAVTPRIGLRFTGRGGYAFGAEHAFGELGATVATGSGTIAADVFLNRPVDRPLAGRISGVMNSVTSAIAARDYTDPYLAHGSSLEIARPAGGRARYVTAASLERHRRAERVVDEGVFDDAFREVLPVTPGEYLRALAGVQRPGVAGLSRDLFGEMRLAFGHTLSGEAGDWIEPTVTVGMVRRWGGGTDAEVTLSAGALFGDAPLQSHYLLGGWGSVPGFPFRAYGGDRYALLNLGLSRDLWQPWLRWRLLGSVGSVGGAALLRAPDPAQPVEPIEGATKGSFGVGIGVLYDILRLDLHRGLGSGGGWELVIDASPAFRDFL